MSQEMEQYYAKRALEYEEIYLKPERQECIKESKTLLKSIFKSKNILEIACGTGFWTEPISEAASSIMAIDLNTEVLEIAKNKQYGCQVTFMEDDSYKLSKVTKRYDSLFAGFWFSHIPKSKVKEFLELVHSKLDNNAILVFMDNLYVEGSSTPVSRYDSEGNSYQIRPLKDGSKHEVLKNFYSTEELKSVFSSYGNNITVSDYRYFWILKYNKAN